MEMMEGSNGILKIDPLGFPWATRDPFLFCVYHADAYPAGDGAFGIDETTNIESDKILQEAAAVAENSTGDLFPSVPTSTTSTAASSKFL